MRDMVGCGLVTNARDGVKVLSDGADEFVAPVTVEAARFSEAARDRVGAVGGAARSVYYNKLGLRAHLKPEKFAVIPRRARPPPRLLKYYIDDLDAIEHTHEGPRGVKAQPPSE
jgi:large subunit ribosomal protein L15